MNLLKLIFSNVLIILFASGCATSVSTNIKPTTETIAKYSGLSAVEVVATLEKNVNAAEKAGMTLLSPNYFHEAVQVLKACQSGLPGMSRDAVVNNAAKGDAILEKGRSVMEIVKYRFSKELELKDQLEEKNAHGLLPTEYAAVIGELNRLITKVEREQPDNIDKDKEGLLKSMSALVIKTVQVGVLRESETLNEESQKSNADKQAPLTYAESLRVYQNAKNEIAAAYADQDLVERLGAAALFAARHAKYVNERVALLQTQLKISPPSSAPVSSGSAHAGAQADANSKDTGKVTVEMIVLQEEDRLLDISTVLKLRDLRDMPLEKQVEAINRAASEVALQANNAIATQDIEARLESANKGIQQALSELAQKDVLLAEKDRQLSEKDRQIAEKDKQIAEKDIQLTEKDKQMSEKDKQAANKDKQLAGRNAEIKALKDKLHAMKLM
jgi:hypothetical protein